MAPVKPLKLMRSYGVLQGSRHVAVSCVEYSLAEQAVWREE